MKLNIGNIEDVQSKTFNKEHIFNKIKLMGKAVGMGVLMAAFIIGATGCSDNLTQEQVQVQTQKEQNQINQEFVQHTVESAKAEGMAVQVNSDNTLSYVALDGNQPGDIVFETPELKAQFENYHETLSQDSEAMEIAQANPDNNETATIQQAQSNAVAHTHSSGGSNALLWYWIGSQMNSNHHSGFYRHYSNNTYSNMYKSNAFSGKSGLNYDTNINSKTKTSFGNKIKDNISKTKSSFSKSKSCSS